jgi:alpha-D-xyloside xylohydrolase
MKIQLLNLKLFVGVVLLTSILMMNKAQATVISYSKSPAGVTFKLDKGVMKINIFNQDIIEVKYTLMESMPAKQSLVVNNEWKMTSAFTVTENAQEFIITTSRLKVKINKATNSIKYTDLKDVIILAEDGTMGKQITPAKIAGIDTYNCATEFNSPADEALFGMGCHPEDTLSINYKGRNQSMAIKYMTGAIPVMLSNKGYGLLWDNYSASNFLGGEEGNTKYKYISESGTMVDYYFFYGPEFDHIISLYRQATGVAPMFGKWAFGLFQSQDRYKSQAEILGVAENYRKNKLPLDCIVQDWYYWEPNVIGSHVMYADRYPNPKLMVDELHKNNLHAMISIWPVMAKGTPNFDEMVKAGQMTDITWKNVVTGTYDSYYDAHSEKARQIYWRQAYEQLIKPDNWDAWWVDQCEPDNGTLLDARRKSTFALGKGIDFFNTYSLMHTTGLYTNWRKDVPGKRAFFLVRQAFAGQQRNAATLWSSDITCTFRAFKSQVPQGINACTSGIPYWTSDIGGYHFKWNAPNWSTPANRELFTRWFQFGTFSPVFRIHGKGERALFSDVWDADTKRILLNYDNLRYRLMPYIYSLSWKVTNENYTIMRSLAFDFRNDASVYNIPDQYMFGPAFLVNPVTEQLYSGKLVSTSKNKTRNVYLPKSVNWYDFWTGKTFEGGQTIAASAPIETMPLYIKAGSIVPMGSFLQYATEKPADPIELRIYPGAAGQFTIYEDENDNYNYEKGVHSTITLLWNDLTKTLTIKKREGSFPGMIMKRTFNVILVKENHGVGVELADKIDKTIVYNGTMQQIKF